MYTYDINVWVPDEEAPEEGFPVVYVLDGQRYAQMMQLILREQLRNRKKTGVMPMIIVSIGHQEIHNPEQRFYDFTTPSEHLPGRAASMKNGGAEQFQAYLKDVMQEIAMNYPVNSKNQMLFGHSLGGLFTLWSYIQSPMFHAYAAISPSIWWDEHALLQQTPNEERPLFLAVGSEEKEMVNAAQVFSENLSIEAQVMKNENHASVIPSVMSQVLRFFKENSVTSSRVTATVEKMK